MKKLIGLFAAAALVFGVVSCANDDGVLSVKDAVSGTKDTLTFTKENAAFNVKNSKGLEVTSLKFKKGGKDTLTPSAFSSDKVTVVMSSSDATVAALTNVEGTFNYNVEALELGEAVITVTVNGVVAKTINVVVEDGIEITGNNFVFLTQTTKLAATADVTWTVKEAEDAATAGEATVDADGVVTASKEGVVTIVATDANGATAEYDVEVVKSKAFEFADMSDDDKTVLGGAPAEGGLIKKGEYTILDGNVTIFASADDKLKWKVWDNEKFKGYGVNIGTNAFTEPTTADVVNAGLSKDQELGLAYYIKVAAPGAGKYNVKVEYATNNSSKAGKYYLVLTDAGAPIVEDNGNVKGAKGKVLATSLLGTDSIPKTDSGVIESWEIKDFEFGDTEAVYLSFLRGGAGGGALIKSVTYEIVTEEEEEIEKATELEADQVKAFADAEKALKDYTKCDIVKEGKALTITLTIPGKAAADESKEDVTIVAPAEGFDITGSNIYESAKEEVEDVELVIKGTIGDDGIVWEAADAEAEIAGTPAWFTAVYDILTSELIEDGVAETELNKVSETDSKPLYGKLRALISAIIQVVEAEHVELS